MITAVLAAAVIWFTLYGSVPVPALIAVCAGAGALLLGLLRRGHGHFISIDVFAQASRLNNVNPSLKATAVLLLMALCIASKGPIAGAFLTVLTLCLAVFAGGLKLRDYASLLSLPVSFLMISSLALLFEITSAKTGVLSVPVFGVYLSVSAASQQRAALVLSHALGAVSCLYLLSLTTPMSGIIGVLRRARCPNALISLMYLVYRYIFILLNMHRAMRDAAASRLGFRDYGTSVRTTARLYSVLLANSYMKAGTNFDAMESRCYDAEIRFIERGRRVRASHAAFAALIVATLAILAYFV